MSNHANHSSLTTHHYPFPPLRSERKEVERVLKGISPLLQPELLKILAEMGHGDELVIGDGNFPAASMGKRCVRCDGHGVNELLDAILQLFPLDDFVAEPVTLMAVGCVRALREKGISVPKDVSIIGMDDLNICQVTNPPLSTIRVYREDISRIAVQRLVAMMSPAAPKSVQKTEVSVTLVDRQSIRDLNTN